jgi:hypothetical protein
MATVALNDPFIAVIVDVPLATEVTNPDDDTVATDELDEDHVTVGLEITVPPASLIVGTTVTVSPTDANVFSVGVIVIDVPTWATVIDAVAVAEPEVAVIVDDPFATAVTRPEELTVATAASDEDHVTAWPIIAVPPASLTVGTTVTVSPTDVNVWVVGVSSINVAAWATVMVAVAVAESEVAVIVAVPFAAEVTRPTESTVATAVSDETHITAGLEITVPPASLPVGTSVTVSPMKVNVLDVGVSSIDTAACPTVIDAVAVSEPEVAVIVAVPFATEVTIPTESTVAIASSDEDSVTVSPAITVPPPSLTVAVNVAVSPTDVNVWVVGVSSINVAAWATVMVAVAVSEPEIANIVTEPPKEIAVTSPLDRTVATTPSDEAHVTVWPVITVPSASFTVGTSVTVSPMKVNVSDVGVSSINVGTCAVGAVGVLASPPHPAKNHMMDTVHSWFFIAPPSGVYSVYDPQTRPVKTIC